MWYRYVAFRRVRLRGIVQINAFISVNEIYIWKKIYPENRMYNKQFSTGVSGEIRFVVIANQIVAWGRLSWVLESYSMHVANGFSLN